jgi:outer membrane protein TolC
MRSSLCTRILSASLFTVVAATAHAQISLQSAVNLALKNSPKVRAAQADLAKARAAHGEAIDAYVPQVSTTAGYGQSTGAPLGVPIIFSISAQSLLFSYSQRDYIRSTEASVNAAEHALHAIETEIVEDTTNTYIALANANERKTVFQQELGFADRLVTVTGERIAAGVDARVELPRARRTATQIRLAALLVDDEITNDRAHLSTLTGLPASGIVPDKSTIPAFSAPVPTTEWNGDAIPDSEGIKAAFATAQAKQYAAFGDHRYLLRPQVSLASNYSRVDVGLSSYANYYPRYSGTADTPNSQNSFSYGIQFTLPLLDMAHRSKARQSAAEAARALADAQQQRGVYREGRAKLRNAAVELDLRAQLARDDREIAQDQLDTLKLQMAQSANDNGPQVTPKDQLNAQLQERQKYIDVLNSELQLQQTQVNLLRQTEELGPWVIGANGGRTLTPSLPNTAPASNTLGIPGQLPAAPQPGPAPAPRP